MLYLSRTILYRGLLLVQFVFSCRSARQGDAHCRRTNSITRQDLPPSPAPREPIPRAAAPASLRSVLINFKSQNFKLSVSNPKNKYVAYLSVLSRISNCQGLGRKNKFEILKTDHNCYYDAAYTCGSSRAAALVADAVLFT